MPAPPTPYPAGSFPPPWLTSDSPLLETFLILPPTYSGWSLRDPLTVIFGSATSLLDFGPTVGGAILLIVVAQCLLNWVAKADVSQVGLICGHGQDPGLWEQTPEDSGSNGSSPHAISSDHRWLQAIDFLLSSLLWCRRLKLARCMLIARWGIWIL